MQLREPSNTHVYVWRYDWQSQTIQHALLHAPRPPLVRPIDQTPSASVLPPKLFCNPWPVPKHGAMFEGTMDNDLCPYLTLNVWALWLATLPPLPPIIADALVPYVGWLLMILNDHLECNNDLLCLLCLCTAWSLALPAKTLATFNPVLDWLILARLLNCLWPNWCFACVHWTTEVWRASHLSIWDMMVTRPCNVFACCLHCHCQWSATTLNCEKLCLDLCAPSWRYACEGTV